MPKAESTNSEPKVHYEVKFLRKILVWFLIAVALFVVLDLNYILYSVRSAVTGRGRVEVKNQNTENLSALPANFLYIEALAIKVPIVYVKENSEKVFQEALKNGVVHFPLTALPGQTGNVYIFGHSSDYVWSKGSYKTVFAPLTKIHNGDKVQISSPDGTNYVYTVTGSFVAGPNDVKYLSQETKGKKLLTLQTSWPLGTALKRWIVIAEIK